MIKRLISKLTRPKNLYIDTVGGFWVECLYRPDVTKYGWIYKDFSYSHNYQEVAKDWLGVWRKKPSWYSRSEPLQRAEEEQR